MHIQDVPQDDVPHLFQVLFGDMIVYNLTVTLVKFSAILFFYRTFPSRKLRLCLWVVAVVVLLWFVGTELAVVFQCSPVHKFWDQEVDGTCIDLRTYLFAQAIPNIVTDIIILALPLRSLYCLQISYHILD